MGKQSAIANALFLVAPILLGISIAFMGIFPVAQLLPVSVGLSLLAVVLLAIAKLPMFRAGAWIAFGPSALPKQARPVYYTSYVVAVIAVCSWFALAVSSAHA